MATKLDKAIKREIELDGEAYMVSMSPEGVTIKPKGKRKGHEISWRALLSGDVDLAQQLTISLDAFTGSSSDEQPEKGKRKKR